MIQDPSKEVTLIVYNTPAPPKYIKINKRLIRYILMVVPALIIIFLAGSLFYSIYLKNKVSELKALEPQIKSQLDDQKSEYEKQISELEKTNKELTNKISRGSTTNQSTSSLMGLFVTPIGAKDLRSENAATISNTKVEVSGNKIKFIINFLKNESYNQKVSGKLTVIQYQGNMIQYWPEGDPNEKNLKLEFSSGQIFGMNRSVVKEAEFNKVSDASARYKVYLFSNTGDLIFYQQLGPFNIE
ncbi:MAG: hypothetical protein CME62_01905 [Halobacteriovoraceae bacterium]|nr:hypothetical protein [Halobacteriovoraceae bacterium]|tara:strand:- start:19390 stop:20118 length:729 start_codon:yes stop_codon:yes gene_type:complete